MFDYLQHLKSIADSLTAIYCSVSNKDLVIQALNGLPCNSLNFRSFSRDLRNEIDQCTYSEISSGNAHSRDANLRGKASTGLSSHDQRTWPWFDLRLYGLTRECFEPTEIGLFDWLCPKGTSDKPSQLYDNRGRLGSSKFKRDLT